MNRKGAMAVLQLSSTVFQFKVKSQSRCIKSLYILMGFDLTQDENFNTFDGFSVS